MGFGEGAKPCPGGIIEDDLITQEGKAFRLTNCSSLHNNEEVYLIAT